MPDMRYEYYVCVSQIDHHGSSPLYLSNDDDDDDDDDDDGS